MLRSSGATRLDARDDYALDTENDLGFRPGLLSASRQENKKIITLLWRARAGGKYLPVSISNVRPDQQVQHGPFRLAAGARL